MSQEAKSVEVWSPYVQQQTSSMVNPVTFPGQPQKKQKQVENIAGDGKDMEWQNYYCLLKICRGKMIGLIQ